MKDFLFKKSGFTLIEIVVAVVISSLVILGLTTLLLKLNQDIFDIQNKTSIYSDFSKFQSDFNNYKLKYPKGINIVDNSSGYDVLLLTNSGSERGILVGVVDITSSSDYYLHLDPVSNYDIYGEKVLGIKELSVTQTQNILINSGAVYNLQFYATNLYNSMKVDSLVINHYNSGSILDISMDLITDFSPAYIGQDRESIIDSENKFRINFSIAKDTNILLPFTTSELVFPVPAWTLTGGGDCSTVDNSIGTNGDTSNCIDTRIYNMLGGINHSRQYDIIFYNGNWWFNQNLRYPLDDVLFTATGMTWPGVTDNGMFTCPNGDCNLVASGGYLYQWSAAMSGAVSTSNTGSRAQGICPAGWAIPTNTDVSLFCTSKPSGWSLPYLGQREPTFYSNFGSIEFAWISENHPNGTGYARHLAQFVGGGQNCYDNDKSNGLPIRCIKN